MKLLSNGIIENYLVPYINSKWTSMQQDTSIDSERRFPFIVEEAVLNTALTGSIFRYMLDNNDYSSTLVSEAKVKRSGDRNGRCDIIWYSDETIHYIELKGAFYGYDKAKATVNQTLNYLNEAVKQVYSIVSNDSPQTENEHFYGYIPKSRYGFIGGIIFSEVADNGQASSFGVYQELLKDDKLSIGSGIKPVIYAKQFEGSPVDISYYKQDGQKELIKSDGYFLICTEYKIKGG